MFAYPIYSSQRQRLSTWETGRVQGRPHGQSPHASPVAKVSGGAYCVTPWRRFSCKDDHPRAKRELDLSPRSTAYPILVRDPIHHWIGFTSEERKVINSAPVQRLRQIHQLAMTSLVYPGATHTRFEHSLGVMHVASQIYNNVVDPEHVDARVRNILEAIHDEDKLRHWELILRMAALCHDIGHLPFSHAAETELLPTGWTHERITYELIMSPEMAVVWDDLDPYLRPDLIAKLALGAKQLQKIQSDAVFSDWEAILSEIIVGDAFGADRLDYLLRDSYHAGVAYGTYDHFRLIDTLRILPPAPAGEGDEQQSAEPALGIQYGGMQAAESMMLARSFMFSQVYFHQARIIYDRHLQDFLSAWLPSGRFSVGVKAFLEVTDNEVMTALLEAARDASKPGHRAACAILQRSHFRVGYRRDPSRLSLEEPGLRVYEAAKAEFGDAFVRYGKRVLKPPSVDYPVLLPDNGLASASSLSVVKVAPQTYEYVYVDPEKRGAFKEWLDKNLESLTAKQIRGPADESS